MHFDFRGGLRRTRRTTGGITQCLAEFFGLWGLAVKAASLFGPLTYGAVTWMYGGNHRLAILTTGAYFLVGLLLLRGIDVERGRAAALA